MLTLLVATTHAPEPCSRNCGPLGVVLATTERKADPMHRTEIHSVRFNVFCVQFRKLPVKFAQRTGQEAFKQNSRMAVPGAAVSLWTHEQLRNVAIAVPRATTKKMFMEGRLALERRRT